MIDFKNKKVIWLCSGIAALLIIVIAGILLLVRQNNNKKAEQAEKDRIAQEEKKRIEMESLKIAEAPAPETTTTEPARIETPVTTQPTKNTNSSTTTTSTTPTTPVVTPDPTPVVDPKALTITAKYDDTNTTPEMITGGEYKDYYLVDPLNTLIRLDYTAVEGTTLVATVESGGYWFIKVSDTKYKFIEGGNGVVRFDLIDANGNIVKTGRCKLTTPRG